MLFANPRADVFVPHLGLTPEAALARSTHLCIAAHQDDIEIMAYAGITECYERPDKGFAGVVVTNGAGSPRVGPYASYTDEQMQNVRREEQRAAAALGKYSIQIQLAHPSAAVKTRATEVQSDLDLILAGCTPDVVYLHQPADKHDTHIAVLVNCIEAFRRLPPGRRPKKILGCEVWRDLDWLPDEAKQPLDSGKNPGLASAIIAVFDSQITGGKRYDLATLGRRRANATFHTSHATDSLEAITWAMDLTPLVADPTMDILQFALQHVDRFRADVSARISRYSF